MFYYEVFFALIFSGEYFAAVIILLALSTAMTVVILNFKHRGVFGGRVPGWVRVMILHVLASMLCLREVVDRNLPCDRKVNSD